MTAVMLPQLWPDGPADVAGMLYALAVMVLVAWAVGRATNRPQLEEVPMTVRCKVRCTGTAPAEPPGPYSASFVAVTAGSPENEAFFAATPGASLTLSVVREQYFEAGKEYYLDLTPAP